MAGRDYSSNRKSSKKKRNKTSSLKKIPKRESKKASRIHDSDSEHTSSSASESDCKIRTRKNKKLRCDHSKSSSSEVRSLSSDTSSDYKRKKKARRSRLNLKSKKKEGRDRSSRPQDDGKENSSGKKRKRSSRDVEKAVKKSSKRKKTKKCSSSSSSETNSIESYEARKKRQVRSPSVSHVPSDGELLPVNNDDIINNNYNSRRLRSVIAVVDHQQYNEAENRWDPHKEEVVYDPNDFPSPKSLNSNEEGIETELDNQSFYESRYNEGALDNDGDRQLEVVDMSSNFEKEKVVDMLSSNFEKEKDSDTSVPIAALGGDVLESILRQKALENLKKFKGRIQTDGTSTHSKLNKESDIDKPSDVLVGKELIEQGTSNSQEPNLNSGSAEKNDISEVKKLSGSENEGEESRLDTCPGGDIRDVGSNSIAELSPSSTRLEGENEAKDGSEFKEKTMSVMRGGEMVQVSYKVYIPKKSPALGRKTLKR